MFNLVQVKEFKGTPGGQSVENVEGQINAFFQELAAKAEAGANIEIMDIKYSTSIIQYRKPGEQAVYNAIVSSALVLYNYEEFIPE
jgi:hypothetical protein